jgi:arylsulfatase
LVAHWPKGIDEKLNGKMDSQPAHLIDLMATCADLGKATYPEKVKEQAIVPLQGVSIAAAFTGKKIERKNPIFWEHEGNRAIRIGKWKLVAKGSKGPWELYDLEQDRTELNDLTGKHSERAEKMAGLWEAWAVEAKAKPWPWGGSAKKKGSKKKTFNLKEKDLLDMENAPMIANKAFEVEAQYQGEGDGVLVAQGGDAHGWVLYLEDDRLHFGVCRNGKFSVVKATSPLESKIRKGLVQLHKNGEVKFFDGKQVIGEGKLAGLVSEMPIDGLQVGRDEGGTVGLYKDAFPFPGEVKKLRIKIN